MSKITEVAELVEKGKANSHKGLGWETFTLNVVHYLNEREKNFDIPPKEMKLLSDYLKELKDPNRSIRIALQEEREQSVKKAIEREEK